MTFLEILSYWWCQKSAFRAFVSDTCSVRKSINVTCNQQTYFCWPWRPLVRYSAAGSVWRTQLESRWTSICRADPLNTPEPVERNVSTWRQTFMRDLFQPIWIRKTDADVKISLRMWPFFFFCSEDIKKTAQPYFGVSILKCRILFVHLKVDLSRRDGQSASSHHHRSYQLSRCTQHHRAWGGKRFTQVSLLEVFTAPTEAHDTQQ